MKLKELLEDVFKDGEINPYDTLSSIGIKNYTLYGEKELSVIKEKLLDCEEFSEVTELELVSTPVISVDGNSLMVQSFKISDGVKLMGKGYLLSVMLSPQMYDPNKVNEPVKDGACITPTFYNAETFEPTKKIVLTYSPERPANEMGSEELIRQELHDLLDKVFDNPEEYVVKGERGVLVRGIFEVANTPGSGTKVQNLSGIINKQNSIPDHFLVFYLKKVDEKNIRLEKKVIPIEKKELYLQKFKEELIPTEEEINKFLEENKQYGN